ncbi:hypothetical protein M405DRAFT_834041 [Rhizopogon salebrosus TDB-379]|nr:hypothetical protein M405DRAFT_834041 [Rhizopogon salebrosus TDB-379]
MKAPAVKILIETSRKPGTITPNKKRKPNDGHGEDNEDKLFEGDADTFEFTVNGA